MGPEDSGRVSRAPPYSGTASPEDTDARKGVSPATPRLSSRFRLGVLGTQGPPYYPRGASTPRVWALSASLAATGDIDLFLSSPAGTKMFQFPASAPGPHGPGVQAPPARVAPFGHSRIVSRLQIPATFRSSPRPSSPPEAKASSVRSSSLLK